MNGPRCARCAERLDGGLDLREGESAGGGAPAAKASILSAACIAVHALIFGALPCLVLPLQCRMKDDIKSYLTSVGVDWQEVDDLAQVPCGG